MRCRTAVRPGMCAVKQRRCLCMRRMRVLSERGRRSGMPAIHTRGVNNARWELVTALRRGAAAVLEVVSKLLWLGGVAP